jgi:hypothetical protein
MTDTIWYVWLAAVLASFGIIQYARMRKYGVRGTFSYTVMWRMLFTDHERILQGEAPRKPRVFIYFVAMAPFLWFLLHFGGGGRFG